MARKRVTNDEFDELHGLVGQYLLHKLRAWQADPSNPELFLSPAELAQALKMLSENQINRPAFTGKKARVQDIPLPNLDDDDNVVPFTSLKG